MLTPTYPEDTNGVERAERRPVGLNHAEHTVELPVDEEDDEEVVRVPEPLEVGTATLLNSEPDHDSEGGGHDPSSRTRTSDEVGGNEGKELLPEGYRVWIDHDELGKVDHVGDNVHDGEDDNGPGDSLVEGDVLVERNEGVERRPTEHGDEVSADGEKDEGDIDVEDEGSGTGDSCIECTRRVAQSAGYGASRGGCQGLTEGDTEGGAGGNRAVLELVMHEAKGDDKEMEEDEDEEEHAPAALINHPVVELLAHRAGHEGSDGSGST